MSRFLFILFLASSFCLPAFTSAGEMPEVPGNSNIWPQWRGPSRDGQWTGPAWPERLSRDALIRMSIGDGKPVDLRIANMTQTCKLPLAELKSGDYTVQFQVLVAGKPTMTRQLTVSRAENLATRLGKLKNIADKIETTQTIEQATLRHLLKVTADLAAENVMETDMPAARLLHEAEELALVIARDAPYYDATRPGQFWLRIPTGKTTETVRVFVPERLNKAKPVPIVLTLNGAGAGSPRYAIGIPPSASPMCNCAGLTDSGSTPTVSRRAMAAHACSTWSVTLSPSGSSGASLTPGS